MRQRKSPFPHSTESVSSSPEAISFLSSTVPLRILFILHLLTLLETGAKQIMKGN